MTFKAMNGCLVIMLVAACAEVAYATPQEPVAPVGGAPDASEFLKVKPVEKPQDFGVPAAAGATNEQAVQKARELVAAPEGPTAVLVQVPSGIGALARGEATYSLSERSRRLALEGHRAAAIRASSLARRNLAALLHGERMKAHVAHMKASLSIEESDSSRAGAAKRDEESYESVVEGWLQGVVIESINDDTANGRISVTVITTPATMRTVRSNGGLEAAVSIDEARAKLEQELVKGVLPPVGTRVLRVPGSNTRIYAGYSVYVADADPQREEANQKHARMACQSSLLATLKGESLAGKDFSRTVFTESPGNLTDADMSEAGGVAFKSGNRCMTSQQSVLKLANEGRLPPGVQPVQLVPKSGSGDWKYMVAVWQDGGIAPSIVGGASLGATATESGEPSGAAAAPAPTGGAVPSRAAVTRTSDGTAKVAIARGEGTTREAAVRRALLEALSMVNGALMAGATATSKIYADATSDLEGDITNLKVSAVAVAETCTQSTRGLIRSYKVLEDGTLKDGGVYVVVEAVVPIFDPKNPRPGRRRTVVVLPFTRPVTQFQMAGASLGAADLDRRVCAGLVERLVKDARFTVLDRAYMGAHKAELDRIELQAAAGHLAREDALKLGNQLSADLLITGTLESFSVDESTRFIELTNERIVNRTLTVVIGVVALDVASGEQIAAHSVARNLDHKALRALGLSSAEQLAGWALNEACEEIHAELGKSLKKRMAVDRGETQRTTPSIVRDIKGDKVLLTADLGTIKRKDRLEVARIELIAGDGGEAIKFRNKIAVLEVVDVQGALIVAVVVEGKLEAIKVGDEAVLPVPEDDGEAPMSQGQESA